MSKIITFFKNSDLLDYVTYIRVTRVLEKILIHVVEN